MFLALRNDDYVVNELGLYDLERKIRPVGEAYNELIKQWGPVLDNETLGLQFRSR